MNREIGLDIVEEVGASVSTSDRGGTAGSISKERKPAKKESSIFKISKQPYFNI